MGAGVFLGGLEFPIGTSAPLRCDTFLATIITGSVVLMVFS